MMELDVQEKARARSAIPHVNPAELLPEDFVLRQRLLDFLDQAVRGPVTVVTAPAGYGKSTLVTDWGKRRDHRMVWVALESVDNSVDHFMKHFSRSLCTIFPLADTPPDLPSDFIFFLIDTADALAEDIVLVIDDYHLIDNGEIHALMNALVQRIPSRLHLILITRSEHPLRLGRLRLRGLVRALTQAELSFTHDEAVQFFTAHRESSLSRKQIEEIVDKTDGWIAGMKLTSMSSHGHPLATKEALRHSGDFRVLDAYIEEEILDSLPDDLREFVLGTAGLPVLDIDLCNAVLETVDAFPLLEELRLRMPFVVPLGESGSHLRYHHLIGESFNRIAERRVAADVRLRRLRRAAAWFEYAGEREQAIESAILAREWDHVVSLMRSLGRELADRGRTFSLLHWLDRLPRFVVLGDAEFAFWQIHALYCSGQIDRARTLFEGVEASWLESDEVAQRGRRYVCYMMHAGFQVDFDAMSRYARLVLDILPESFAVERMYALTFLAEVQGSTGDEEAMMTAYADARRVRDQLPAEQWWWTQYVEPTLANFWALHGDLDVAAQLHGEVSASHTGDAIRTGGKPAYHRASIALEQNDLVAARQFLDLFADDGIVEDERPYYWIPELWVTMAQVAVAEGEYEPALDLVRRALVHAREKGEAEHVARAEAVLADMWIADGQLALARSWANQADFSWASWARNFGDVDARIVRVRLFLAEHDAQGALDILEPMIATATAVNRRAELIRAYVHCAVARAELHDMTGAIADLDQAVRHGTRGRFIRSFMVPNHDLLPILQQVDHRHHDADYLRQLEGALRGAILPPHVPQLPSPQVDQPRSILSDRERDVLSLAMTGLTNQGIAERLFISEHTVKKHFANVNKKLKTTNRIEAIRRAYELHIV